MATKGDEDWFKDQLKNAKELIREAKSWRESFEGISRQSRKDDLESIRRKKQEILEISAKSGKMTEDAKELLKVYDAQEKKLKSQYEVIGRITQEVNVTYRQFKNFLETSADQYNYAQKIAKEYLTVSRNIGAGEGAQERLTRGFKDALPEVEQMGGSMEDITDMMVTIAEESGRIKLTDRDDIVNIEKIAKATNMSASEAAKMAEQFDLMGVSTDMMIDNLQDVFKESQKLGLNASKVVKAMSSNMKSIQSYSFVNGVRGMTEMAKQAVKMRIDVSDVLAMADKFYEPEAAIEAAANLQMLGGDIAKAFGDPFQTMYLARNKPEELAKRVGEMTENMLQFNEASGEYELPAEARMQLKAAGDQLGINVEKMTEMARQSSKIKDLKMKFTSVGDNEMKENLASLAKYSKERGEFVIEHKGEELGLNEISDGMAEEIVKANANEGKTDSQLFKNIAINTQTMSEQLKSMKESAMATVAGTTDLYEITAENMKDALVTPMKKSMDLAVASFKESFNPEDMFDTTAWKNTVGEFGTELKEMQEDTIDYIENLINKKVSGPGNVGPDGKPLPPTTTTTKVIAEGQANVLISLDPEFKRFIDAANSGSSDIILKKMQKFIADGMPDLNADGSTNIADLLLINV